MHASLKFIFLQFIFLHTQLEVRMYERVVRISFKTVLDSENLYLNTQTIYLTHFKLLVTGVWAVATRAGFRVLFALLPRLSL